MASGLRTKTHAILAWLAGRASYMLLAAADERLAQEPPERFRRAWAPLMLISLAWGVFLAWLWATAWTVFGDHSGIHLMHVATVVAAMALWLYRRSLLSLGRCLGGQDPRVQNLVCTVTLVVLALAMLGLRRPYDPDMVTMLPPVWRWTCPMVVQRVLILMPLWGAWGMVMACQFGKPSPQAPGAVRAFAEGCTAPAAAMAMVLPLAGTLLYFYFLNWWRVMIPAATILGAILIGLACCRRKAGLTREGLLTVNFLTQVAFLLAYLGTR